MEFLFSWLNLTFLYTLALIVIVSSRHIQSSNSEAQQDASKSGKPGEYLWYRTGSLQTESKVAKSLIAKASRGLEESGAVPSEEEKDLSGSGEASEESPSEDMENSDTSGSGSYPTSYMVDIPESSDIEQNSAKSAQETTTDDHDVPEDNKQEEERTAKDESESTERETNEDISGSANIEEESSMNENDREDTKSNENEGEVKIMAPDVRKKQGMSPKKRSDIYRKNKAENLNDDSEYDKLFKDFGTEGDLGPGLEDEDSYLDDSISEEEARLLIPGEGEDDAGKSKSEISRPDNNKGEPSPVFRDILDDGSASEASGEYGHAKSHSAITKEILSKLDSDVFRGNHSEEHVQFHRKKHRHHKLHHLPHHHDRNEDQTSKEEDDDASRALSHHADSGIFNGSVSNETLEAEKVKKHPKHHHKHYHHHGHRRHGHHHRHHDHRHRHHKHHHHHHTVPKGIANDNQVNLQQPNSNVQYSPQVQHPSVYYPYPSTYPAQQQMSPYQSYQTEPTSEYEYHSLKNADSQGAVCLDGSAPGYYLKRGSGAGSKKWIIYLQGGAWCDTEESCLERSQMHLGSSLFFKPLENPGGLLSSKKEENPKFYNWNVAYLPYCDGSSFSGNRSDPVEVEGSLLYFRGLRILDSTLSELLSDTDLKHSRHVVFSGTSAGGLAVMLHADFVRSKLPRKVRFRALADSGFFLDTHSRKHKGHPKFRKEMQNVFKLHDCTDGVPQKCVDEMSGKDLWKCIFPQYFLPFVKSKMFIVNPLYDSWQLQHIWEIDCASNPYSCTKKEVKLIKKFRKATLRAMAPVFKKSNLGLFADACVDHGQVVYSNRWNSIKVKRKTISSTFIKWLRNSSKKKYFIDDDVYPANPTCVTFGVAKRSDIFTEGF